MTSEWYAEGVNDEQSGWFRSADDHDEMIIACGGLVEKGFLGIAPFEFVNLMDALPVTKIFLRDLDQSWYHRGVRGLGDSLPEVAAHLRPMVAGRRRLVFIGHSSGGYAALLLGSLLEAQCVIATAPQTFISRRLRWYHNDDRWPDEMRHTYAAPRLERSMLDTKPFVRRARSTEFRIYYSIKHRWDPAHAVRFRGFPNVALESFTTPTHSVARLMRDNGLLLPLLRESLALDR